MNPDTGNFHPLLSKEDAERHEKELYDQMRADLGRAHAVTEQEAKDWTKFRKGEIVTVKGIEMRITGITRKRLILQPVQQEHSKRKRSNFP